MMLLLAQIVSVVVVLHVVGLGTLIVFGVVCLFKGVK